MAELFDCSADNIGLHLKNIYDTKELDKEATTEKISVVQLEGAREVRRNTQFYNLDAIISVGYRVNSIRATQFRQWCTYVIRQFSLRGYIIDKKRMENGSFIGEDYFEHLLAVMPSCPTQEWCLPNTPRSLQRLSLRSTV